MDIMTNLAEMLIQVGQSSGDDTSIAIALSTTCDGERLSTACLSVGEDCTIVTCQHTETDNTETLKRTISS